MSDVIRLLPDSIANQIAAGEVIQRPASVVKELLENALDAGASSIQLIIKDAGRTLIQVVDDGCGMSETDARMAFERHATSKIQTADDLFQLRTMGFRGEALASIASVAQVEMRTRRRIDELGVRIQIEDSKVIAQEPCQSNPGTTFWVKNLFYNVPARRNFLKSDTVEMRHIQEDFIRVAIPNPDIAFSLHHNGTEIMRLPAGNARQRAVAILGNKAEQSLVPVVQETDVLQVDGFVGKPEFAKKNRGEQYLFVNKRFIRSNYLHHAIMGAYEELLPKETMPSYILLLDIDPARIDVNVHPTKTEIKFEDERVIYNLIKVGVRHALGLHHAMPMLDFDQETSFNPSMKPDRPEPEQPEWNTERRIETKQSNWSKDPVAGPADRQQNNQRHWEKLFENLSKDTEALDKEQQQTTNKDVSYELNQAVLDLPDMVTITSNASNVEGETAPLREQATVEKLPYQIHNCYIISPIKSGFLLIDQYLAHQRILYERYIKALREQPVTSQRLLFPKSWHVNALDAMVLKDMIPILTQLGFEISDLGSGSFAIYGIPAGKKEHQDETAMLEALLQNYKDNTPYKLNMHENMARSLARSAAVKRGQALTIQEMKTLIDELFACELPFQSPMGKPTIITYELEDIRKTFE